MAGDIDPSLIEWRSRRYERGRPTPVSITFPLPGNKRASATFRATPDDARAAIADLEAHAYPRLIDQATLTMALADIGGQRSRGTRPYVRIAAGVKLSASPEAARALLADLKFWTLRDKPEVIRNSAVVHVLNVVSAAKLTRWGVTRQAINALLGLDGPWIAAFVNRVKGPAVDRHDAAMLVRILTAAEKAGYERRQFFRRSDGQRVLAWPLQAFLLEHCLGGAHWWTEASLIPPMQLIQQEMTRRRDSADDAGRRNIFQHYLGADWRAVVDRPPRPGYVPRRLRRL